MAKIRNYRRGDLDAVYRICLKTGASGKDATHLYRDPKVIGHVYAGAYVAFAPESALVLEDDEGIGGYVIGVVDTHAFEKKLEREWWPELRSAYPDPSGRPHMQWSADEQMAYLIHYPSRTPRRIAEPYPSHLHIDLVPRLQGQGHGKRMLDTWFDEMKAQGSRGAHLGVGPANARAVRFYQSYGLKEIERLDPPFNVIYFGREL